MKCEVGEGSDVPWSRKRNAPREMDRTACRLRGMKTQAGGSSPALALGVRRNSQVQPTIVHLANPFRNTIRTQCGRQVLFERVRVSPTRDGGEDKDKQLRADPAIFLSVACCNITLVNRASTE